VTHLNNAIDWAKNGNPILHKFICYRPYEDKPNINLSDKDQELLDKLKLPDFMEKEKSKSPTPPSNLTGTSMNHLTTSVEIPPIDID
jgi:hypothetical protein